MKTFQGRMCLWSMDAQDKQDVYRWFVEHVQAADAGGSDLEEEQDHAAAARMHDHIVIEFNHKDMEFLFYTPVHERFLDHAAETMKPRVVGLERYLGILSNASLLIACRARKVAQKHWCTRRRRYPCFLFFLS